MYNFTHKKRKLEKRKKKEEEEGREEEEIKSGHYFTEIFINNMITYFTK